MTKGSVIFHDHHPCKDDMQNDVVTGLSQSPRILPPKYFYDEKGSHLFDLITRTKDYYPTRTEVSIFQESKQDFVQYLPRSCVLIEPGGGSFSKVLNFIHELQPHIYVPIDISKQYLQASAEQLVEKIPWLEVHAICDDFTKRFKLPDDIPDKPRVVFFPGSSIGNFHPAEVIEFLKNIASLVGNTGQLLIGVDLKKDKVILERAYDDTEGITAQFNLNLLTRINNELSATFDLNEWMHRSLYNEELGRVEMHLESQCEQVVDVLDHEFYFAQGETIHTENSYKYTVQEFIALASEANFVSQKVWQDNEKLFSVHLFKVQLD